MTLLLRYAIRSHVGLIRDGNEDSGYAGPTLLAIADGMGGQAAGELASSVVLSTMARLDAASGETRINSPSAAETMHISAHDLAALESGVRPVDQPGMGEPDLAALGGAVVAANERLRAIVAERPEFEGMGTTLTAMLWSGSRFGMVHVGDSRAYRLRDGLLEQMTADHTWVQRLVDEGRITEEEAGHHPQRSLLMRALDGRTQVEADIGTFDAYAGDRYLLCSDGLSGFVSQETLAETLAAYQDPQAAVDALIELALRAGGPDNITCIVADTLDDGTGAVGNPNDATTVLGTVTPVVVGAASENADRLPHYLENDPATVMTRQPQPDDFPQNHPAGRAARLRPRRGQQQGAGPVLTAQQQQMQATQPLPAVPAADHAVRPGQLPANGPAVQTMSAPGAPYDPVAAAEREAVPAPRAQPMRRSRAGDGAGGPADQEPSGGRKKRWLIVGGVAVVVLGGLAAGGYLWTQGKYYVGVSGDGRKVVAYQGIKQGFLGLGLSSELAAQSADLYLVTLPTAAQGTVRDGITVSSKADAATKIEGYRTLAQQCYTYRHRATGLPKTAQDTPATAPTTDPSSGAPASPGATTDPAQTSSSPSATSSPAPSATPPTGTAPSPEQDMKTLCLGAEDAPAS